jgi:hypothetical protein
MKYQVGNTVSLSADNRKHLYTPKKKFGDLSILYQKSETTSMPKNGKTYGVNWEISKISNIMAYKNSTKTKTEALSGLGKVLNFTDFNPPNGDKYPNTAWQTGSS